MNKDKNAPAYYGHRERMRLRLRESGSRHLATYELLEMLLYYAIPRRNTHPTAKLLLSSFASVKGVFRATREELLKISGVGEAVSDFLASVGNLINAEEETKKADNKVSFSDYGSTGEFLYRYLKGKKTPSVYLLMLDTKMNFIDFREVYALDLSSGGVKAKKFIDMAMNADAALCIIAHNHPYGAHFPTESDRETNKLLNLAFREAGLTLVESYIVTDERYNGFMTHLESGLSQLPELSGFMKSKSALVNNEKPLVKYLLPILKYSAKEPMAISEMLDLNFATKQRLFESNLKRLKTITQDGSSSELIYLIAALASRVQTDSFRFGKRHTEEEIRDFLIGSYINTSVETVFALSLDQSDRILGIDYLSEGTVNFSSVIPRMIIEKLSARGADAVIVAHNHPGGFSEPSESDISSTRNLARSLELCGIRFVAHYIIGGGACEKIDF